MKFTYYLFRHVILLFLLSLGISSCSQKSEQNKEKAFHPEFEIGNYGISNTDKIIAVYTTFPCGELGSCGEYRDTLNIKFDSTVMYVTGKRCYFNDSFNDSLYKLIGTKDWKNIPELTILSDSIIAIKMTDNIPTHYSTDGEHVYYFNEKIDTIKTKVFIAVNEELLISKTKIYSKGKPIDRKIVSFPIRFLE